MAMSRQSKPIGLVRCKTDTATMRTLAARIGLEVQPAHEPFMFYLANSGRSDDREIESELFEAAGRQFDDAVSAGVIEIWTPLLRPM